MPKAAPITPSALSLRTSHLLSGLNDGQLALIASKLAWRRFARGQRVTSRSAPDSDVYLIVSGAVRITAFSGGGRQITYRDLNKDEWFGEMSSLDGGARSADVEALDDCVLASMTPGEFRRLLSEYPEVCSRVLGRLASIVRDLTERILDISTLGVQNRLHAEILRLAKDAGVEENAACIDPAPTHGEIASRISTYREQVTRELRTIEKQGLIVRRRRQWMVPDVARLERMVEEVRRLV